MSKLRKLNVSEVEGNENSIFPPGTVWIDSQNSLRISDGETEGGNPAVSAGADLGNLKITGSVLGTKDNPDTGGWGGYNIYLDPGQESSAYIFIPGLTGQTEGAALQINNTGDASSIVQVFGRGGVQVVTNTGETEKVFSFNDDGSLTFSDTTSQETAYQTNQTTVLLNAITENGAAGYTFASLAPAVIFFEPDVDYTAGNLQVVYLTAPTYPGQKVSLISDYNGQVQVIWPWGESTNTVTLNAYENSELTAVNHPSQGLTYWETNRYSW